MLLAQLIRVACARLAIGQIAFGQRLDPIQSLEVFKRLRYASIRRFRLAVVTGLFFPAS
jgi:hypothetical protein